MALTKDKIIDELVTVCKLQRREAVDLLDTFLDHIKHGVANGERIRLAGFGSFFLKYHKYQRKRRDIVATEDTPKWRTPSFHPSTKVQARIQYADIACSRDVD